MKSWVWILAVADTENCCGTQLAVFQERAKAQDEFRNALKQYGGNRRYDIRLAWLTSVEPFPTANPQYKPVGS